MRFRDYVKSVLPESTQAYLRRNGQRFFFSRGMKQFIRHRENVSDRALSDLVYGWGNVGYSAEHEFLRALLRMAREARGPILECGSGLSTILVGHIAQQHGNRLWSLEHHPGWAERVRGRLSECGIESVEICVAPLKDYGEFTWYDPPSDDLPDAFSLVICDGPPHNTHGGRYGLLPVIRNRLAPASTIMLDDAEREEERQIAQRWCEESGGHYQVDGTKKPYLRIQLP